MKKCLMTSMICACCCGCSEWFEPVEGDKPDMYADNGSTITVTTQDGEGNTQDTGDRPSTTTTQPDNE